MQKANSSPHASFSWLTVNVRRPMRSSFASRNSPPRKSSARTVYSGCAPYPFGHQSFGSSTRHFPSEKEICFPSGVCSVIFTSRLSAFSASVESLFPTLSFNIRALLSALCGNTRYSASAISPSCAFSGNISFVSADRKTFPSMCSCLICRSDSSAFS